MCHPRYIATGIARVGMKGERFSLRNILLPDTKWATIAVRSPYIAPSGLVSAETKIAMPRTKSRRGLDVSPLSHVIASQDTMARLAEKNIVSIPVATWKAVAGSDTRRDTDSKDFIPISSWKMARLRCHVR